MVRIARTVAPYGDEAFAEEIVQDALVAVLKNDVDLPEAVDQALAVLYRRIRNVGLNRCRRERIRQTKPLNQKDVADYVEEVDPWKEATRIHSARDVRMAFETLSPAEQDVIALHVLNGHTFGEVAQHRGSSPKTAKELHRRGKAKLHAALKERRHAPSGRAEPVLNTPPDPTT